MEFQSPPMRPDPVKMAESLGISLAAADLFTSTEVIDLHIESYSFYRSFGYDPRRRHGRGLHGALLFSQADLPRLATVGVQGATWVITANPLRPEEDREQALVHQLSELLTLLSSSPQPAQAVSTESEFYQAVAHGQHAAFIGIQGANALPGDLQFLDKIAQTVIRITLLHMSDSVWGCSSTPRFRLHDPGLTHRGFELVEAMNHYKIAVDLAHIHPRGFWDAVRAHDPYLPLLVTHTGVSGVHRHWRNLDDAQLRAVARTGGVVGIMYHAMYLGEGLLSGTVARVAQHILHAVAVIGDDHVSLGSDWDGLICTPRDMPTCLELPRLVDELLRAGLSESSIQKILGKNFLRVIRQLRGTKT